jgi:hypothetical protein
MFMIRQEFLKMLESPYFYDAGIAFDDPNRNSSIDTFYLRIKDDAPIEIKKLFLEYRELIISAQKKGKDL